MKVYELLTFNKELLNKIVVASIRHDDYQYIGLYDEYAAMKERGEKVTYIIAHLSDRYHLSRQGCQTWRLSPDTF